MEFNEKVTFDLDEDVFFVITDVLDTLKSLNLFKAVILSQCEDIFMSSVLILIGECYYPYRNTSVSPYSVEGQAWGPEASPFTIQWISL